MDTNLFNFAGYAFPLDEVRFARALNGFQRNILYRFLGVVDLDAGLFHLYFHLLYLCL